MKPIEKYGIRLRQVQESDIEQVRKWRNAPHVREAMEFRDKITPEMQAIWWQGLDPTCNFYYLIEQEGHAISQRPCLPAPCTRDDQRLPRRSRHRRELLVVQLRAVVNPVRGTGGGMQGVVAGHEGSA